MNAATLLEADCQDLEFRSKRIVEKIDDMLEEIRTEHWNACIRDGIRELEFLMKNDCGPRAEGLAMAIEVLEEMKR